MSTKVFIGGLAAGIAMFFAGFLIYGILMADYFMSSMPTYPGLYREEMMIGSIGAGNLLWGFLLAWLLRSAGVSTVLRGAVFGAIAFFLYSTGTALVSYGQMNLYTIQSVFVEGLCMAVMGAVGGLVAAAILSRQ